jgi:cytochrome c oxidase accessory protein FixG
MEEFRDRVATVSAEGRRVWVYPRFQTGQFFTRRAAVAAVLWTILFAGPWIRIGGQPLLLLDIVHLKFVVFGAVFWPQDAFLFALAMVTGVVAIALFTVVFGRIFCGWVCPQTVFMEFLFRPIERAIEGDRAARMRRDAGPWTADKLLRKTLKFLAFYAVSFAIANTFLAYIIGSDALLAIQRDPPHEHLGGLSAMAVFSFVFFYVFARLREQVCTTICPYGRLQGVLVDKDTVNVTYDYVRGEPRGHARRDAVQNHLGDCVDCSLCVQVCPMGIDIRNGLQLECVHCTACMDACDGVMQKLDRPAGLIRYASERSIASRVPFQLTLRAKAYTAVLGLLVIALGALLLTRSAVELQVFRTAGTLYQVAEDGHISNLYRYTLVNKTNDTLSLALVAEDGRFRLTEVSAAGADLGAVVVPPNGQTEGMFFARADGNDLASGRNTLRLNCTDNRGTLTTVRTEFPAP